MIENEDTTMLDPVTSAVSVIIVIMFLIFAIL